MLWIKKVLDYFYWLRQDYKAWKRGERRIAPRGSTGRVYEKKENVLQAQPPPVASSGAMKVNGRGSATLQMKITRKATGEIEYIEVPATVEEIK